MRFEDEQYVRLYRRDTTTWKMLPWQAKCILPLILRKVDRAGLLDLGSDGLDALVMHIEVPLEVIEAGMAALIKRRVLILRDDGMLMWPKFIEGQEAKQSDKARQKSARDKARDLAQAKALGIGGDASTAPKPTPEAPPGGPQATVTVGDAAVTQRDSRATSRDETVTPGHATSRGVTLSCADLSCADLSLTPIAPGGSGLGSESERQPTQERVVNLGTAREQACCEAFVAALAEAGVRRVPLRDRWDRQALCDAINVYLRADGTADGILSALRAAVVEWVGAYRDRANYTGGWRPGKFADWLSTERGHVGPPSGAPPTSSRRWPADPLPPPEPPLSSEAEAAVDAELEATIHALSTAHMVTVDPAVLEAGRAPVTRRQRGAGT